MKDYFIRLFNYDKHMNLQLADIITKAGGPGDSVKLMAHLLSAQQVWFARCSGGSNTGRILWPDNWTPDMLPNIIEENSQDWLSLLSTLTPADFDKIISYQNMQGDQFETRLSDILTQVTNHGTHHRAQIVQQLKLAGVEYLPFTDYIAYIRTYND